VGGGKTSIGGDCQTFSKIWRGGPSVLRGKEEQRSMESDSAGGGPPSNEKTSTTLYKHTGKRDENYGTSEP